MPIAKPSGRLWTKKTTKTRTERRTRAPLISPTWTSRPRSASRATARKATPMSKPTATSAVDPSSVAGGEQAHDRRNGHHARGHPPERRLPDRMLRPCPGRRPESRPARSPRPVPSRPRAPRPSGTGPSEGGWQAHRPLATVVPTGRLHVADPDDSPPAPAGYSRFMYRNVVVAYDGSEVARIALARAAGIARSDGASRHWLKRWPARCRPRRPAARPGQAREAGDGPRGPEQGHRAGRS